MNKLSLKIRSITAIFWLGFFMAISFMEAPLKFTASGLSMAEGLRIGKIIFGALNICEWSFLLIILVTCILRKPTQKGFYLIAAVSLIMVAETAWLLPVLDHNANLIIQGAPVTSHAEHWFYVLFEIAKAPVLLMIGLESGKALMEERI